LEIWGFKDLGIGIYEFRDVYIYEFGYLKDSGIWGFKDLGT